VRTWCVAAAAGMLACFGCGGRDAPEGAASGPVPVMRQGRLAHTQTKLADGRAVVAGGLLSARGLLPPANNDVEVFDPARGKFTVVAEMKTVRATHSATLLEDGRVVFIGGTPGTRVDVFNPHTARMESGGDVLSSRGMHTATLLGDGRILVVGGATHLVTYHNGDFHAEGRYLNTIELYDVRTGTARPFSATLKVPRRGHTATLLADGRVLVIGGTWQKRTEIIDVTAETVTWGPVVGTPREDHRTTRLVDGPSPAGVPIHRDAGGRLLVTGGTATIGKATSVDVAEIYDPQTESFRTVTARMNRAREDHTADLLPDGRVLITGGEDNAAGPDGRDIVLDDVEVFDPKTETFTRLAPLSVPRDDHGSTVLVDGRVLVTGGEDKDDAGLSSAEFVVVPGRKPVPP